MQLGQCSSAAAGSSARRGSARGAQQHPTTALRRSPVVASGRIRQPARTLSTERSSLLTVINAQHTTGQTTPNAHHSASAERGFPALLVFWTYQQNQPFF